MTRPSDILLIDDEASIRFSLRGILEDEGYAVREAGSGEEGLAAIAEQEPHLVFLDVWLPAMDGLSVMEQLADRHPLLPVVIISGHGTIETAVSAIKLGAHDFIEKPLSLEKVVVAAKKALEYRTLRKENQTLRSRLSAEITTEIVGQSPAMLTVRRQIAQVAPTDAWVLITGENGTGKEVIARAIHASSRRANKPWVAMNCAAIPEELIESELFGHVKGSFTGADRNKDGKFEQAHEGTLFLDEIGDMSLKTQAKILRILQEQRFERVGGSRTVEVDVRVLAATNKDLRKEIRSGGFREDLFYRLNVYPIDVPPLRERSEDLEGFIRHFVTTMACKENYHPITFSKDALRAMGRYAWPGNVRELKNIVERLMIMHAGEEITADKLPEEMRRAEAYVAPDACAVSFGDDFREARNAFEKQFLEERVKAHGGNITQLAEQIGLERSYLYRKLKALGISSGE